MYRIINAKNVVIIGFNECVFICTSLVADIRLRYFTPGHEMPLCGHAAIQENQTYIVEPQAGVLNIIYTAKEQSLKQQQTKQELTPFTDSQKSLCDTLHTRPTDLYPELPIVYGSTGSWTVLVLES